MEFWSRIVLADVPWQPQPGYDGVFVRLLGESVEAGPPVMHIRFVANYVEPPHWHGLDTLYVITAGELTVGSEGVYRVGDIRWVRAGTFYGPEVAGPEGCEFVLAGLSGEGLGLDYDSATAKRMGSLLAPKD